MDTCEYCGEETEKKCKKCHISCCENCLDTEQLVCPDCAENEEEDLESKEEDFEEKEAE